MNGIWKNVKNQIKSELVDKSFSLWINPITLLEEKDNALVLGCPNKFSRNWIMDNYLGIIAKKLEETGYGHYKLSLKVMPLAKRISSPDILRESRQLTLPHMQKNGRNRGIGLNNEFTFDRFVVGKCNEFAYSVSNSIAMGDNGSYDSLFVLANTGLGKSHLSQAIVHAILDRNPKKRVCYITAEDFLNEMIYSLKNSRIEEFKDKYRRNCDVLLLEEVHFLGGKQKTQLELGYTLDVLSNGHKKIIFTSSLLPKDIPNMTKELSSRLTSGIITTIDKPDYMTRVNILEKKSSEQNLSLSEEIIHLLAKNLTLDIRQIESTLSCLKAKSELLKANITLDLASESLKCHVSDLGATSIDDIKKLVCQYFKIDPTMLASKSRKKIHAYPRNIYSFLCRRYTDETLENIGQSINRNHSTVLYASEVIEHKMKLEKKVKNQVDFFSKRLEDITK